MASNLKVKKSKKSYDNKVITWISIGLAAFIAVVVAIVLIITLTTGYVAKVDGLKIYDYEYIYFCRVQCIRNIRRILRSRRALTI